MRERERDRDRQTETDRQRERDRDRDVTNFLLDSDLDGGYTTIYSTVYKCNCKTTLRV